MIIPDQLYGRLDNVVSLRDSGWDRNSGAWEMIRTLQAHMAGDDGGDGVDMHFYDDVYDSQFSFYNLGGVATVMEDTTRNGRSSGLVNHGKWVYSPRFKESTHMDPGCVVPVIPGLGLWCADVVNTQVAHSIHRADFAPYGVAAPVLNDQLLRVADNQSLRKKTGDWIASIADLQARLSIHGGHQLEPIARVDTQGGTYFDTSTDVVVDWDSGSYFTNDMRNGYGNPMSIPWLTVKQIVYDAWYQDKYNHNPIRYRSGLMRKLMEHAKFYCQPDAGDTVRLEHLMTPAILGLDNPRTDLLDCTAAGVFDWMEKWEVFNAEHDLLKMVRNGRELFAITKHQVERGAGRLNPDELDTWEKTYHFTVGTILAYLVNSYLGTLIETSDYL